MRAALYFFGACFLVFGASIFYTTNAIVSRIDDVKYLVAQAPVVTKHIKATSEELMVLNEKITASLTRLRAAVPTAIPEAGVSLGKAGANAIRGFADKMSNGGEVEPKSNP